MNHIDGLSLTVKLIMVHKTTCYHLYYWKSSIYINLGHYTKLFIIGLLFSNKTIILLECQVYCSIHYFLCSCALLKYLINFLAFQVASAVIDWSHPEGAQFVKSCLERNSRDEITVIWHSLLRETGTDPNQGKGNTKVPD